MIIYQHIPLVCCLTDTEGKHLHNKITALYFLTRYMYKFRLLLKVTKFSQLTSHEQSSIVPVSTTRTQGTKKTWWAEQSLATLFASPIPSYKATLYLHYYNDFLFTQNYTQN